MRRLSLSQLKRRRVIRNPKDIVVETWLRHHPSLGKPDEVVWAYSKVKREFENKIDDQLLFLIT